jgi:hypothetical protein
MDALATFIESEYPFTRIELFTMRMGAAPNLCGGSLEQSEKSIQGLDLIFDVTAQRLTSLISAIQQPFAAPTMIFALLCAIQHELSS